MRKINNANWQRRTESFEWCLILHIPAVCSCLIQRTINKTYAEKRKKSEFESALFRVHPKWNDPNDRKTISIRKKIIL